MVRPGVDGAARRGAHGPRLGALRRRRRRKKPSSAAPGDAFAGVAFFSSGGEKRGAPSSERRRLTRAATPSSVVRLRRLRDVAPSPTLVRDIVVASPLSSAGLPRLLRLPPRLRRRAVRRQRPASSGAVLVASPPTAPASVAVGQPPSCVKVCSRALAKKQRSEMTRGGSD